MRKIERRISLAAMAGLSFFIVLGQMTPAYGMHIMEGFLPIGWAIFWWG